MNILFLTSAHNSLSQRDYSKPGVRGCLHPPMRQPDRSIDWMRDSTEIIARKI